MLAVGVVPIEGRFESCKPAAGRHLRLALSGQISGLSVRANRARIMGEAVARRLKNTRVKNVPKTSACSRIAERKPALSVDELKS